MQNYSTLNPCTRCVYEEQSSSNDGIVRKEQSGHYRTLLCRETSRFRFLQQKNINLAALGLIMSAYTHTVDGQTAAAQAATATSIPISSLPFNITKPGTYVVTSNLASTGSITQSPTGAINVVQNISGPVVIDLKGFTITGLGDYNPQGVYIQFNKFAGPSTYPITVRNGTIKNFWDGIQVLYQDNVTINNIAFLSTGSSCRLWR
jgi:hypothetical protein